MDIVQVILLTLVIQAAGLFYESSLKTTWYNASRICSIALPDINVRESGNYIDTEYQIKNDKVWVGYLKKTTSFEYIGCTSTERLRITKSILIAKNTPGLCYTFCKNKKNIAGLSGDKCYCLTEVPNGDKRQPHCNLTCDVAGIACGGDGYISLYNARNDITASSNEERCYAFQNDGWTGWEQCSKQHRAFCIKNNTILDKNYHAWNEYTNLCFSLQGDIVAFEDKRNITEATGQSWRNIVSSTAFYTYKDAIPGSKSDIEFGYVKRSKQLKFENDENKRMRVLCLNETSSSDVNESSNSKKDIAVPVGISVTVVVLTVCGILAFLYIRRSGRHVKCCRKEEQLGTKTKQLATKTDGERSSSNRNVKDTYQNGSYDHSFEAVHKNNPSQEETVVNSDSNYAHTYMVIEDFDSQPVDESSTYNTTTATRPGIADLHDTNVYNKLELNSNATYDGVLTTKMVAKGHDQTYNTFTGATSAQTTSPKGNSYTTEEDTYNHMNSNSVITNTPDSLYDISSQNTRTSGLE